MQRRTKAAVSAFSSNRFGFLLTPGTASSCAVCRAGGGTGSGRTRIGEGCRSSLRGCDGLAPYAGRTMHAGIRPAAGFFTVWAECLNLPGRYAASPMKVQQMFEFTDSSRRFSPNDRFSKMESFPSAAAAGRNVRIRTPHLTLGLHTRLSRSKLEDLGQALFFNTYLQKQSFFLEIPLSKRLTRQDPVRSRGDPRDIPSLPKVDPVTIKMTSSPDEEQCIRASDC